MKLGRKVSLTVELSKEELADVTNVNIILYYPAGKKTLTIDENYQIHLCHNTLPPPDPGRQAPASARAAATGNGNGQPFIFKRKKVIPYGMSIVNEPLETFIRFFISPRVKKSFETAFYSFFLENPEGKKFKADTATTWKVGLWLLLDPDGLAAACGGKGTTFKAIEYAFKGIRQQLADRVQAISGILPQPRLPRVPLVKRKYTKRKK